MFNRCARQVDNLSLCSNNFLRVKAQQFVFPGPAQPNEYEKKKMLVYFIFKVGPIILLCIVDEIMCFFCFYLSPVLGKD